MKKNILFCMPSLSAGGGEKSLVNLLSQIDYSIYNVDLFLLNHDGLFMEFLPKEVKLLPLPKSYLLFSQPFIISISNLLMKGHLSLAINRAKFTIQNRKKKNDSIREQNTWKYLSKSLNKLEKEYDTAIGFMEKTSTYFCVDKVNASKKIGWVHINYDELGMNPNFDRNYFRKLNHIVTISEECANVLKEKFPKQKDNVEIIYNIVSPTIIRSMANIEDDVYKRRGSELIILSIGRLHYQKGFELAIESCKKLIEKGIQLQWYVLGDGEERENLKNLIKINKLEKNFILLGLKSNPYPYIKQADLYLQTSKFEGKSIAIDEAKILNKPIIVTNYSTAKDQITDGVDGLIVEMESDAIVNGIENLIKQQPLRNTLIQNLKRENLGTEQEINKLYKIL